MLNLLCVSLCITIAISATATSSAQAQPSNAQRLAPNAQFKLIPAGHFVQGRHTGRVSISKVFGKDHLRMNFEMDVPAHPAFITKPFYLATREVTVGQFRQFVEATGYATAAEKSGDGIVGWHGVADQPPRFGRRVKRDPKFTWRSPGFEQTDDHPVVGVSWDDTQAYCRWRSEQDGVAYRQ